MRSNWSQSRPPDRAYLPKSKPALDTGNPLVTTLTDLLPLALSAASAVSIVAPLAHHRGSRRTAARLLPELETARAEALTDPVTQMPNRRAAQRHLGAAIQRGPVLVGMIDVRGLARVNNTFGQSAGDLLLRIVGWALSEVVAPQELAARCGGDEFEVIVSDTGPGQPERLDGLIHAALSRYATASPGGHRLRVCVGWASSRDLASTDVEKAAGFALARAKAAPDADGYAVRSVRHQPDPLPPAPVIPAQRGRAGAIGYAAVSGGGHV